MQIRILRGTHQIGGAVTEIKTKKARIIIDMGTDLPTREGEQRPPLDIEGVTQNSPSCDAVLITHYHGDHVGAFERVLPSVPIYMGHVAKKIFSAVQTATKKRLGKGDPERASQFRTFEPARSLIFGDIKVTPYLVDHSAFDAYMLLIEADGKRVLHTGDFRMHGAKGKKMPLVFETFCKNIDVLIIEGTMMSRKAENVLKEYDLFKRANKLLKDNKHVFVLISSTNIDSIAEFYSAAIANKRVFVVCEDDFQNEILRIVTDNSRSPFYDFSRQKVYTYSKSQKLNKYMDDCGFCFIGRANAITRRAMQAFSDNLLIYSMWTGYLDKTHPAFDEYKTSFVDEAVANGSKQENLHTSGHAKQDDLKKVCKITGAKTIIPIHTEQPQAFLDMDIDAKVEILKDGQSITI